MFVYMLVCSCEFVLYVVGFLYIFRYAWLFLWFVIWLYKLLYVVIVVHLCLWVVYKMQCVGIDVPLFSLVSIVVLVFFMCVHCLFFCCVFKLCIFLWVFYSCVIHCLYVSVSCHMCFIGVYVLSYTFISSCLVVMAFMCVCCKFVISVHMCL